jgi:O-antigen ligase
LLVAVGALAAGIAYFGAFAPAAARHRVSASSGTAGRTDLWRVAWRMVSDRPVEGVGAGNYRAAVPRFVLVPGQLRRSDLVVDRARVVHNSYLEVLAELGAVGLAFLAAVLGFCLRAALRAARAFRRVGDAGLEALSRGVGIGLVGMLAAAAFISAEYEKELWLLLGLAAALERLARRMAPPAAR